MANEVKFLHSGMTGAPTLSGTVGGLIALLDACLVNGFGLGTVDSIVIAGGVATVTRTAGHPFEVGAVAEIAGAGVSGGSINGARGVLSVTSTTYTFDATGLANQTATGTITHKVAALGWAKIYSATNLAAYQSSDPAATDCLLRVDDTDTVNARVTGYVTMTDVNTGTGPFPTSGQVSGGGFWGKSATADGTTRPWVIVGDARGFYLCVNWNSGAGYSTQFFGDLASNKSPDAFACAISVAASSILGTAPGFTNFADVSYADPGSDVYTYVARGVSGLGSSQRMRRTAAIPAGVTAGFSGSAASWITYPNAGDNGLYVVPMMLSELSPSACFRALQPGAYFAPQNIGPSVFANRETITSVAGLSGRSLRAINGSGVMFVDVTGPWR